MKRRLLIVIAASLLFIAANVFAILYNGSPVKRTSFVTAWTEPHQETLVKTYAAKGVAVPAEEHHVYYSADDGGFKEFLVKEGDEVSEGTPLFSYTSDRADADRERLLGEQSLIEQELLLIEEQIGQLEYLQTMAASMESSGQSVMVGGEEVFIDPGLGSGEMLSAAIEKEIFDKEQQRTIAEGNLAEYDERIAQLEENSELEKLSEVAGIVKKIDHKLGSPVITIASDTPKIKGTIPELDLPKLEAGMRAHVTSALLPDKLDGTLSVIATAPEKEPDVEKDSFYTFEIELAEGGLEEDWLEDGAEEPVFEDDIQLEDGGVESEEGAVDLEDFESSLESESSAGDLAAESESGDDDFPGESESSDANSAGEFPEAGDMTPEQVDDLLNSLLEEAERGSGLEDRLGDEDGTAEKNPLDPGLSDPVEEGEEAPADEADGNEDASGEESDGSVPEEDGSGELEDGEFDGGETDGAETATGDPAELVIGSHVNVNIVTDEVQNALTVSHDQLKAGSYVYVIAPGGLIERRSIRLGLDTGSRIQITEGLEAGETILANPKQAAGSKTRFITPADPGLLELKSFREMPLKDIFLAVSVGFSKR